MASLRDGTKRDLLDARDADLVRHDNADWRAQMIRDLAGDGNASSRQAEYSDPWLAAVGTEQSGECASGGGAIAEHRARGHELEWARHHRVLACAHQGYLHRGSTRNTHWAGETGQQPSAPNDYRFATTDSVGHDPRAVPPQAP
jgi:hypothetical protein